MYHIGSICISEGASHGMAVVGIAFSFSNIASVYGQKSHSLSHCLFAPLKFACSGHNDFICTCFLCVIYKIKSCISIPLKDKIANACYTLLVMHLYSHSTLSVYSTQVLTMQNLYLAYDRRPHTDKSVNTLKSCGSNFLW